MKNYDFKNDDDYIKFRQNDFKTFAKNDVKSYLKDIKFYAENRNINSFIDFVNWILESYNWDRIKEIAKNGYDFVLSDDGAIKLKQFMSDELFRQYNKIVKDREKAQAIYNKYLSTINKTNEMLANLDLSDIKDGFPCGSAHIYLNDKTHELAKAVKILFADSGCSVDAFTYKLPLMFQSKGQCINFDRKQCDVAECFLRDNNIPVATYSWID